MMKGRAALRSRPLALKQAANPKPEQPLRNQRLRLRLMLFFDNASVINGTILKETVCLFDFRCAGLAAFEARSGNDSLFPKRGDRWRWPQNRATR
jgi:hypothetical protein